MPPSEPPARRSALLSFRFLSSAALGSLAMGLAAAFGPPAAQLAALGCLVSVVGGLFLAYLGQEEEREARRNAAVESLAAPLALAADADVFRLYRDLCAGLVAVSRLPAGVPRETAVRKLESVAGQVADLAEGRVVFSLTEGWRTVYERLLLSTELDSYRSVAWVRTPGYWQDRPGRQSMEVNFRAVAGGTPVERVAVLSDALWPPDCPLRTSPVFHWLREQNRRGVRLSVLRESDLAREPDLLADLGIYGTAAVGVQELDEAGCTVRFTLDFDPQRVREAVARWQRLALYAVEFAAATAAGPTPSRPT